MVSTIHWIPTADVHGYNLLTDYYEHPTLSSCHELRELELQIPANVLRGKELDCISTIGSTKIEKIIFRHCPHYFLKQATIWTQLDDILIELVKQRRCDTRLEVEFRYHQKMMSWSDQIHLPKFVKEGRVTIWNPQNELVYCSDAARDCGMSGESVVIL
jgi:hypothetical protein